MDTHKGAYIVPAVDRAARILSLLRTEKHMTIAQIAHATGWHKSSVHKLLITLNYHGLLDHDRLTKRYSLGVLLTEYGRIALNNLDFRNIAKPILKDLVDFSRETAALAILRGSQLVLVDVEEPQVQIRVSLNIGMTAPATTTSNGKAVLAWLPESQVNEIMQIEGLPALTRKSITKPELFRAALAAVRERGYATDFEEYQEGVAGISVPVLDSRKQVICAISLAVPAYRMNVSKTRKYGKKCAEMTARLSSMLQ